MLVELEETEAVTDLHASCDWLHSVTLPTTCTQLPIKSLLRAWGCVSAALSVVITNSATRSTSLEAAWINIRKMYMFRHCLLMVGLEYCIG